jgi:hypothetical protein
LLAAAVAIAAPLAGCGPQSIRADYVECTAETKDCDGDPGNGCEVYITTIQNCGACGLTCGGPNTTGSMCVEMECQISCFAPYDDCNDDPSDGCEALIGSADHCGSCYNICAAPHSDGTCVGGQCEYTCDPGWGDCNRDAIDVPPDGCETELNTQQHCGACDVGCTAQCVGGVCEACDSAVTLDSLDPFDAARAMGICGPIVSARWLLPDLFDPPADPTTLSNYHLGHGNMGAFGTVIVPREGSKLLGLSSGSARQPTDPGYMDVSGFDKLYTTGHPPGYPKPSPACPGVVGGQPHDGVGLEIVLDVPEWAQGIGFDFDFYTYEWPGFVCSQYNDYFVALLSPAPPALPDGSISFDSMGNPISVNAAFVTVCGCAGGPPCVAGGVSFTCPEGTAELSGTGFEGLGFEDYHAATSWLQTTAPVTPGSQITLFFAVYDSGDGVLDSTTLLDRFHWLPIPPEVVTEPIP